MEWDFQHIKCKNKPVSTLICKRVLVWSLNNKLAGTEGSTDSPLSKLSRKNIPVDDCPWNNQKFCELLAVLLVYWNWNLCELLRWGAMTRIIRLNWCLPQVVTMSECSDSPYYYAYCILYYFIAVSHSFCKSEWAESDGWRCQVCTSKRLHTGWHIPGVLHQTRTGHV